MQISLKSVKHNRYLTWSPIYIFDHIWVLPRIRNFSGKSCRGNQNAYFVFSNFFPKIVSFMRSSSSSVICQTTGPKPLPKQFLHTVRSRASSFNWQYPLLSLRSSSSFLRLLPRLLVTSICRNILHEIRKRKANWIGHILLRPVQGHHQGCIYKGIQVQRILSKFLAHGWTFIRSSSGVITLRHTSRENSVKTYCTCMHLCIFLMMTL